MKRARSSVVERWLCKPEVAGSNPAGSTFSQIESRIRLEITWSKPNRGLLYYE